MGPQTGNLTGFNPPPFIPRGAGPKKSKREQNADRQREFRRRNPGYYGRLHAKRNAALKAFSERRRAAEQLAALEAAKLAEQESALIAHETILVMQESTLAAQERATIREAPAVTESAKRSVTAASRTPFESKAVSSEQALPEREAMLLLMLMATLSRLQKHRAEAFD